MNYSISRFKSAPPSKGTSGLTSLRRAADLGFSLTLEGLTLGGTRSALFDLMVSLYAVRSLRNEVVFALVVSIALFTITSTSARRLSV